MKLNALATWRWTETQTTYDSYGLPTLVKDLGDTATSADDVCTATTSYARNTTLYLINFPAQSTVTNCTASPSGADYLAGTQVLYDGSGTVGASPTVGKATRTNTLASVAGTTLTWDQSARATYDAHGRVLIAYDALDRTTTTAYTPATGGPTTGVSVTNALSHVTTSTLNPGRGLPTQIVDANLKTTNLAYDPLGRLLKVWLPGRATNLTPNLEYTYLLPG